MYTYIFTYILGWWVIFACVKYLQIHQHGEKNFNFKEKNNDYVYNFFILHFRSSNKKLCFVKTDKKSKIKTDINIVQGIITRINSSSN